MLRAMSMIEQRDTLDGVQYQVIHRFDLKSSKDEEFLPKTDTTAPPYPLTATPIPSMTSMIEERLACLEEG